jgi:hypothetical protein
VPARRSDDTTIVITQYHTRSNSSISGKPSVNIQFHTSLHWFCPSLFNLLSPIDLLILLLEASTLVDHHLAFLHISIRKLLND